MAYQSYINQALRNVYGMRQRQQQQQQQGYEQGYQGYGGYGDFGGLMQRPPEQQPYGDAPTTSKENISPSPGIPSDWTKKPSQQYPGAFEYWNPEGTQVLMPRGYGGAQPTQLPTTPQTAPTTEAFAPPIIDYSKWNTPEFGGGNWGSNLARMEELETGGLNIHEQASALMESAGGFRNMPFWEALQQVLSEGGYSEMIPDYSYIPQPVSKPPQFLRR